MQKSENYYIILYTKKYKNSTKYNDKTKIV